MSDQIGKGLCFELPEGFLAYNDYGELMDVEKLKCPVDSADLTVTETLRLILKAYHNKVSHWWSHLIFYDSFTNIIHRS